MLEPGTQIGGYRIERLVGRGGMGEVYEATQLALGRTVAFKVLQTNLLSDDGFRERFRREGKLQAQLEHPHVVTVYEAGEISEGLFLAMRIVRGSTLKQLIVAGELDAERTLKLLGPVADALDSAHELSLVHRDIKPQNILVGSQDHPFLADFGLTRGSDDSGLTRSGQFVGTIDYISPEQVRGEPATAASDVYALTAVLYECLTGKVPYPRPSDAAVLFAHVSDPPPRVTEGRTELPAEIDEVISRGMAKEPDERPLRASELMEAAAGILAADPAAGRARPSVVGTIERGLRPVEGETEGGADPDEGQPTVTAGGAAGSDRGVAGDETSPAGGKPAPSRPGESTTRPMGSARRRQLTAAVVIAALAAGGAYLVGRSGDGAGEGETLSASVSGNALALRAPPGWAPPSDGTPPQVGGLTLRDQIALVRGGDSVLAGLTDATGPSLLPAELRREAGEPDPVRLGALDALRYRGVPTPGESPLELTIYAVPSTSGVATVACVPAPGPASRLEADCERIAQTLQLVRGRGYGLGADPSAARAAADITAGLRKRREALRARLARAGTNEAQSAAARELAAAYATAQDRLAKVKASPMVADRFDAAAAALAGAVRAYRALAAAARAENSRGYGRAQGSVRKAESRVNDRLAALGSGGDGDG